ncbi:TPA: lysozyme [Yersinia enterocolitica]|nr:lysozyme [Yersinia enterocolitica]
MHINLKLKNKLVGLSSCGGALAIAISLLGGNDGFKGRVYYPYHDVGGILTVCDGHTGENIQPNKYYTDDECNYLLQQDLLWVKHIVDNTVTYPLNDYQRAALYSFTYNIGPQQFIHSTLLKKLNNNDLIGACNELQRWVYAGGKRWKGLVSRREIERELCLIVLKN